MVWKLLTWVMYALEILFFTGVVGCAVVVVVSWVSIFGDGFTGRD
jgi:hypothetical protein